MNDARFIPYGRQTIGDDDIQAVTDVLRSDWLTTGPAVERFEADVCAFHRRAIRDSCQQWHGGPARGHVRLGHWAGR